MHAVYYRLAVIAGIVLSSAGCEAWDAIRANGTVGEFEATFSNESSATVSVAPAGNEDFGAFVLPPGQGRVVRYRWNDSSDVQVEYTYESSHRVAAHQISEVEVVFTDLNTVPTGG